MTGAEPRLRVEKLAPVMAPLVNKFYSRHGARGRASKAEQLYVVRSELEIVAACRVQLYGDFGFLTGVYVDKAFRGRALATELISQVCAEAEQPLFTFPYSHLMAFYQRLGFVLATLPPELFSRFSAYRRQGRGIEACVFVPVKCKARPVA